MAIDASKVQWDAAPAIDPSAVQWDQPQSSIPGVRQPPSQMSPSFAGNVGRGLASLADVTVGGVLPAVVQQIGYPLARIGRSEADAKAATQRLVSAVDQPFGKAFGVNQTPEYQQEAGRQLLDFIGQNFQKGTKWISEKTGLPQADIESYLGSASVAAPKVGRSVQAAAAPAIEKAIVGVKMPFEKQAQARKERMSLEDYAKGPQIEAAADAQRLGIALNPTDIQATAGPKLTSMIAGEKGVEAINAANKGTVRNVALKDLDLPSTTQLNGAAAFKESRAKVAPPYEEVKKLPIQQADDAMISRLENIRTDLDVIGAKDYAPAISKIVDDAIAKTQTGLTGEQLLKNVSILRERARKTYNNRAATTEALDIADTNLKVATELESLIDNSISNPKLLEEYRASRQHMARTYAYEAATDFNTGMVDPQKLARITAKDTALTGDIAALGRIAGNFPDVFTTKAATPWTKAAQIGRTGAAGTLGGLAGYALGQDYASAAMGTVLGAVGGKIGQSAMANRMASPTYQAGLNLRDMRIPVNQLASTTTQQAPQNALIPIAPDVIDASGQPTAPRLRIVDYDVNGKPIYAPMRSDRAPNTPDFTMQSEPTFGNRPTVFESQRGLPNEVPRQIYEAQKRAEMAQEFRAKDERQPARGGTAFELDPVTGKLVPVDTTLRGATPDIQIIEDAGKTLASAVAKMSGQMVPETTGTVYKTQTISPKTGAQPYTRITKREGETTFGREGQAFAMTAEEKIAWNKAKANLVEAAPELAKLTDREITRRMADVKLSEEMLLKARQKAAMFDDYSKQLVGEKARRDAAIKRDEMLDTAEMLEDQLRKSRPVKAGGQGPKTRAHQRNMLRPDGDEIQNALVK